MLVFDQLKKNDPQLRLLALAVFCGLFVLLAGLWWVQIVSAREYQASLETQSFRTVRVPAARGKILDRNGVALAENRPTYNVSLYLEELRDEFIAAYTPRARSVKSSLAEQLREAEKRAGRKLTSQEKRPFIFGVRQKAAVEQASRAEVASNVVMQVSQCLQRPLVFDATNFQRHCQARLSLPYPVATRLAPEQIARFEEQPGIPAGVELEIQATRFYPLQTTAAHLLGHLGRDDRSVRGEEAYFMYRLPDYRGVVGIEYACDAELRGRAGGKSVLVNSAGYRQTETVWSPVEPGSNVVLTIDANIQRAAQKALPVFGPTTRGAAVVMEVTSGDILALASAPAFDPNDYIEGFDQDKWQRMLDPKLRPLLNRATHERYAPGSIFKTVIALACLDNGLNPDATYEVQPDPRNPAKGAYRLAGRLIKDTAPPDTYNFRKALIHSSNSYFVHHGLHAGIRSILALGQRLHLDERMEFDTQQFARGSFPNEKRLRAGWSDGDTANVCIGQGEVAVTPLQMTVLAAAIANGGSVLYPRFVDRIEPQDPAPSAQTTSFPKGRVRDQLGTSQRSLQILRKAMFDDVHDPDGTGTTAFVSGMGICAKTGTAEKEDERGQLVEYITWFLSFAPYDNPRYAVVVMIEGGSSGTGTCGPIVKHIYEAIQQRDAKGAARTDTLAHVQ